MTLQTGTKMTYAPAHKDNTIATHEGNKTRHRDNPRPSRSPDTARQASACPPPPLRPPPWGGPPPARSTFLPATRARSRSRRSAPPPVGSRNVRNDVVPGAVQDSATASTPVDVMVVTEATQVDVPAAVAGGQVQPQGGHRPVPARPACRTQGARPLAGHVGAARQRVPPPVAADAHGKGQAAGRRAGEQPLQPPWRPQGHRLDHNRPKGLCLFVIVAAAVVVIFVVIVCR